MAPDYDLVGLIEICEMMGLSRQRVDVLSRQVGFPAPVVVLGLGRVWKRADIRKWASQVGRSLPGDT